MRILIVTNTGNVTLTSVSVADSKMTTLSCGAATLAPGAQITCLASYQMTQAEVDAGNVHNDATATGNPPTGAPLTATAATDTPITPAAAITLDKTASAPTAMIAGSTIDYTFLVTNSGNVTLTLIGIDDPLVGPVTCPVASLQPTASTTCTKTYTLTQADVDAGKVVNTATASGAPPTGGAVTGTDSTTTPITANPGIVLDKQAGVPSGNKAGDTVPYTFLVTNSGTVTLTSVTVLDVKVAPLTCPTDTLGTGASMTCTGTYVLLQSDVDAGHVANSATAYGQPPSGLPVSATDTTDTPIAEAPNLTLVKTAGTPVPDNRAGSTITYSFLVTNTGNVTMTLIGVTDAKAGAVACPVPSLDPTQATTCTATYTLTQADVDAEQVINTATAHGTSPLGTVTTSDQSTITTPVPADPKMVLDKQAGTPSVNAAGGRITYTFIVTNTGNVTLDPIFIVDSMVGAVNCPLTGLAPAASMTCSKTYALLQSDVDAGTVHNVATARGVTMRDVEVFSTDAVDTPIVANPQLTLDKQAGVPSGGKAGDTIAYTFVVANTGNVTLDPIAFSDAKVDTSTCSTAALAVGASRSCTVPYVLTQADVDAGHVANTATVTATPPGVGATPVTATDSTDTPVASAATIALVKSAGAPSGNTAGSTVPYSFLVTNTGNVTLTSVLVSDSKVGAVNCPATTLLPGASTTCTATYTMSQADVDAGTVHNDASVAGNPPSGAPATAASSTDTPIVAAPAVTLDKQAGAPSANAEGGTIAYTFVVKNTGNVTLSAVGVTDAKVGAVTCPQDTLAPGASTTCTATYTLLQSDVDAATVHNSATASGKQPVTVANPDPAPVTAVDAVDVAVPAAPAITMDKQAGSPSANIVGGTIAYTFLVTNTGNVTLASVRVTDAKVGTVVCPSTSLAPGASTTCTATYTLLQSDVDGENVYNFATASGTPPVTSVTPVPTPVTASDAVNVPIISAPAITVDKQAAAPSANAVGGTIAYTFLVTNSGNVTLGSISVADAKVGAVSCPDTTLIPGAFTTCTATFTLTQADVDAGTVHNSATVTGLPGASAGNPDPAPVTATDAVDVPLPADPKLTIDKTHTAPATNTVGATVAYSFLVTNTGNVTLSAVSVADAKVGAVTCPVATLLPGASTTCTASYSLLQADVDAGVVNNTATASGTQPATAALPIPTPVTAVDTDTLPVPAAPTISVDKTHAAPATNTAGAMVAYSFLVTNTGNVTLTSVGVTDVKVGAVSCPSDTLLPGASTTCTASYTLTQADVDSGVVDNTATASGTQPATAALPVPPPVTAVDTDTLPVPAAPAVTVDKQASGPATNTAGATIAYTFLVTNTGNVTLEAVGVADAKVGTVLCPDTTLAPGASTTCTASYTLLQSDVDAGTVHNSATASATPPVTVADPTPTPVTATDAVDVPLPAAPKVTVDKQAGAPSAMVAGATIDYTFLVANAGNVTLDSVAILDAKVGAVSCPGTTLAPSASMTCTATYTLTQADVDAGHVANTATAQGTPPATPSNPSPTPVSAGDSTDTTVLGAPAITMAKTAGAPSANVAGGTIAYSFLVTNTGNVTLTGVTVTDAKVGAVTCPGTTLAPAAFTTCTATYTLTQADVDSGTVHNDASVAGTPPTGAPVTATDAVDVSIPAAPAITLVKSAAAPSADVDGGTIAYSFLVTNTGNVTLDAVSVADATVGTVLCPDTTLAPAAFTTCTATYTLTQADVDAGTVHNSATASGTPPVTAADPTPTPVTATDAVDVPVPAAPVVTLVKSAGAPSANAAGGTIAYSFLVTNTGNVTLDTVGVADAMVGTVSCPVTVLAPAAFTTCTATYTLTQADVDAGNVHNSATASGTPPVTVADPTPTPVTATDAVDVQVPSVPAITLVKAGSAPSANVAGATIDYTFLVTNTGNVTLGAISVTDAKVGAVSCPITTLAPAGFTTCTATYTLTQADVNAGTVHNDATASGLPPATAADPTPAPVTATDAVDTSVTPDPRLTLVKSAAGPTGNTPGATIAYSFLVTNTGNVTLSSVSVADAKVGLVTCPVLTLNPGAATTCTATYTLTQPDVDAGTVHNSATASGTPPVTVADPTPTPVTATDAVDVTVPAAPSITMVKSAGAPSADVAGATIAYSFLVTNTGNVTLSSVTVADPKVGTVSCPVTTLAPAAFTTCTATYTLTQADVDAGTVHNSATASGTQPVTAANPDPTPVTAGGAVDVPIPAAPAITLDKQAGVPSGFNTGDTITYSFVVTNTGNVTLSSVVVTDAKVGTVSCPVTTIAPAASTTCTGAYTLTQLDVDAGHVANSATVAGDPPTGDPVTDADDTDTLIPAAPLLTLEKQPGARSGTSAGSTIEFTFLVTNTGNVTLTTITVIDTKVPAVTCPVSTLAPGESTTCTATYTLTAADVKAGSVFNSARASGILLGCVGDCEAVVADDSVTVAVPPNTGSPVGPLAPVVALLMLACGGAMVLAGRRRSRI